MIQSAKHEFLWLTHVVISPISAMAVGLETRAPFLDKDVVECAARIKPGMKLRDGRGKWLVRQVLYRHIPAILVDRPKSGFGVPLDEWLRRPPKVTDFRSAVARTVAAHKFVQFKGCGDEGARAHERSSQLRSLALEVLMVQAWHDAWRTVR